MNLIIHFFLLAGYFILCSAKTGRIKAEFFDFDTFRSINVESLKSDKDIHPSSIRAPEVENFVYNIGTKVNEICDQEEAIACIQFKGDTFYYSMSTARSWDLSDTGNDIKLISNISVPFTFPQTIPENQSVVSIQALQLKMYFTCSNHQANVLSSVIFNSIYKLEIFNPIVCQSVFDYYSEACYRYRILFVIVIFYTNIFMAFQCRRKESRLDENHRRMLIFVNHVLFIIFCCITFYTILAKNSPSFNKFYSCTFVIIIVDIFIFFVLCVILTAVTMQIVTAKIFFFYPNAVAISLIIYNIGFYRTEFAFFFVIYMLFLFIIYFIFLFRNETFLTYSYEILKIFYSNFAMF